MVHYRDGALQGWCIIGMVHYRDGALQGWCIIGMVLSLGPSELNKVASKTH